MKWIKAIFLGIVTFVAIVIVGIGILFYLYGFHPKDWIEQYGQEAEPYAKKILGGEPADLPPSLSEFHIEGGKAYVSFWKPSGPLESHGMAYSLDGKKPDCGLGGEPRVIRWSHVKDNWYFWGAD